MDLPYKGSELSSETFPISQFNDTTNLSRRPSYKKSIRLYGNHESVNLQYSDPEIAQEHKVHVQSKRKLLNFLYLVGFLIIGVLVAAIGSIVMSATRLFIELRQKDEGNIYPKHITLGIWNAITLSFALTSSILVTYVEPKAFGGGTVFVKIFLNGLRVDEFFTLRILITKIVAVICALSADLPGGFEGPMIFIGGVIGGKVCNLFYYLGHSDLRASAYFKDANAIKDFVLAGVVAGVGSGFRAPIGGILLALEEAASCWDYKWIVISLIVASMSTFCTQLMMAALTGKPVSLYGEFRSESIEEISFSYGEIPIFMAMGAIGGIFGALWTIMNVRINRLRSKFLVTKWLKVMEVGIFTVTMSTTSYILFHIVNDCHLGKPVGDDNKLMCPGGYPSPIKHLLLDPPAEGINYLFSRKERGPIPPTSLLIFLVYYFCSSSYGWGLSVTMGNFLPQLFLGAIWGRLIGNLLLMGFPNWGFITAEKYALLGAASQLVGVTRTPVSSSVIMLEVTSMTPAFISPLICALLCAKFTADFITEGLFEREVDKYPILPWQPFKCALKRNAAEIMHAPIVCLLIREKVSYVYRILKDTVHVGFPVVQDTEEEFRAHGILIGFVVREILFFILKNKCYEETRDIWTLGVAAKYISRSRKTILLETVPEPSSEEMDYTIDLTSFMTKSVFRVFQDDYAPALFGNFRGLGLAHVVVVDEYNRTVGIISRKDLLCD